MGVADGLGVMRRDNIADRFVESSTTMETPGQGVAADGTVCSGDDNCSLGATEEDFYDVKAFMVAMV